MDRVGCHHQFVAIKSDVPNRIADSNVVNQKEWEGVGISKQASAELGNNWFSVRPTNQLW